jgi:hypothetical protein
MGNLIPGGALGFFASKLAPTGKVPIPRTKEMLYCNDNDQKYRFRYRLQPSLLPLAKE